MGTVLGDLKETFDDDVVTASWGYGAGLMIVFLFALWVRWLPAGSMEYLQALDPYMIARMSGSIIEQGSLPFVDAWRFFPYATPTYLLNLGNIYVPAYMYYIVELFGVSFLSWAKFYPALMGALTVIPVYMMISRIFDRKAGLLSAFFLAASPSIMHRSSAGWFEKEPVANAFMMVSLWLFIKAWDEEDWLPGIGAGIALAAAGTSWGGTLFMYLLYPTVAMVIVFGIPLVSYLPAVLFGDGMRPLSIDGLFRAYTPTILLGMILSWLWNGSSSTWMLPNNFFLVAVGILGIVAVRWAAERFEWIGEDSLPFVGIWMMTAGGIAALLSPLYSQTLSSMLTRFFKSALQTGGGVIGSTVAENQPASLGQVVQQTGAINAGRLLPGIGPYTEYVSGWTFGLIGFSFLIVSMYLLVLRSYSGIESVSDTRLVAGGMSVLAVLSILLEQVFRGTQPQAFIPALVITGFGGVFYSIGKFVAENDIKQWMIASIGVWVVLFVFVSYTGLVVFSALLSIVAAVLMSFLNYQNDREVSITYGWSVILVLIMVASTIYGAIQRSRLVFLASTPIAIAAGIGLSQCLDRLLEWKGWTLIADIDPDMLLKQGAVLVIITAVVVVNGAAVYAAGVSLGGSPNDRWMDNLEHMREDTPPGSVILSWWDYGYWFETIGERPAVADGGNMGYYTGENVSKINYPLADFLTSENASNYTEWLDGLSVDYIVLDKTMIGKYTAVSTISKRGGSPDTMLSVQCVPERVGGQRRCKQSRMNNMTVIHYSSNQLQRMLGRNAELLMPVGSGAEGSIRLAGTPLLRVGRATIQISRFCSEEGIVDVMGEEGVQGSMSEAIRGSLQQNRPFGGCVAFDPARRPGSAVIVPPNIMESTLVRLYLMDGAGIDFVEKEEGGSNGFVRMWEVTG